MGVPERERYKGVESLFEEIIAESIPSMGKETDTHSLEAQRAPNKKNSWKTTPRHIIIKLAKIKDETILKATTGSYL